MIGFGVRTVFKPKTRLRVLGTTKAVRFRFVQEQVGSFSRDRMRHVMDVRLRGLRAFRSRPASKQQRSYMVTLTHIKEQSRLSLIAYGRSRMADELKEIGLKVGRRRVGRPMRQNGISGGVKADCFLSASSIRIPEAWWHGPPAIVRYGTSRSVCRTSPSPSDNPERLDPSHGSGQSRLFTRLTKYPEPNWLQSINEWIGNCYGDAALKTFFKTIKAELIWRDSWEPGRPTEMALCVFTNSFYNPRRRHSALG